MKILDAHRKIGFPIRLVASLLVSFALISCISGFTDASAEDAGSAAAGASSATATSDEGLATFSSTSDVGVSITPVATVTPTPSAGTVSAASTTGSQSSTSGISVESAEAATGINASQEGVSYASGEVLVVYKSGTTQGEATQTVRDTDAVATDSITDDTLVATTVEDGTLAPQTGDKPIALVSLKDGTTVAQAVAELKTDPNVASAQPNYRYTIMEDGDADGSTQGTATENSSSATTMTGQSSISINDTRSSWQWQLDSLGCYGAWSYVRCAHSVGVAVIDTGCNVTHADLADNIEGAYNSVNTTARNDVTDNVGHGTHVAGIISAETNNGIGVSGVSYNAYVIPVKASGYMYKNSYQDDGFFYTDGLVQAYSYIIANASKYNIKVVNMSLGGRISSENDMLLAAIDTAYSDGILTVCAAGNSDGGTFPYYAYPGDYATCVSVINITSSGSRNSGSNYTTSDITAPTSTTSDVNGTKDISAPGTDIYSTTSNGSYGYMTGTSMASPMVAGVAALVFASNSSLTPQQCKSILYSTATDLGTTGWDREYGYGEVNALAAVIKANSASITGDSSVLKGKTATYAASLSGGNTDGWVWSVVNGIGSASINSATGVLTAESARDVTIWAVRSASNGYHAASKKVTIYTASISGADEAAFNTPTAYTLTSNPSSGTWVWSETDGTGRATVDSSSGALTGTKLGTVTVRCSLSGNASVYAEKTVTITKADISSATCSTTDQYYTGSAQTPTPTVTFNGVTLTNGTDFTVVSYGNNVSVGTATISIAGAGNYSGITQTTFDIISPVGVSYSAHVQDIGWQSAVTNGATAGTTGLSKRVEALSVGIYNISNGQAMSGILYRAHVQDVGWQGWVSDGSIAGTTGRSLRVEAMQIKLDSNLSGTYDVFYRAHVQDIGWMDWKMNGETAGTSGFGLRVEALQIVVLPKGQKPSGADSETASVYYQAHVQDLGWQGLKFDGDTAGTTGQGKRIEALRIGIDLPAGSGVADVSYQTHVQNIGWQGWVSDGSIAGTTGRSLRVEALKVKLDDDTAGDYKISYRAHVQDVGWQSWVSDGATAGLTGQSKRVEAIRITLDAR